MQRYTLDPFRTPLEPYNGNIVKEFEKKDFKILGTRNPILGTQRYFERVCFLREDNSGEKIAILGCIPGEKTARAHEEADVTNKKNTHVVEISLCT